MTPSEDRVLNKLKPCPFCGSPGISSYVRDGRVIACQRCLAAAAPAFNGGLGKPSAEELEVHVLKTHPAPFAAVRARKKWLEIRRHDRNFKEGDTLWLEEYDPTTDSKSGEVEVRIVTHVLPGGQYGIETGFCAISMADIPLPHPDTSRYVDGAEENARLRQALQELDAVLGGTPMPNCATMNRLIKASANARAALSHPEGQSALVDAARAMADDYQTSPNHHPQHVLVPLAAFEAMRAALAQPDPLTETSGRVDGGDRG